MLCMVGSVVDNYAVSCDYGVTQIHRVAGLRLGTSSCWPSLLLSPRASWRISGCRFLIAHPLLRPVRSLHDGVLHDFAVFS